MESQRIEDLLQRYTTHTCTAQELTELNNWFHSANHGSSDFQQLINNSGSSEALAADLYHEFEGKNNPLKKVRRLAPFAWMAAAVVLIRTAGATFCFGYWEKTVAKVQRHRIKPGRNKAIL